MRVADGYGGSGRSSEELKTFNSGSSKFLEADRPPKNSKREKGIFYENAGGGLDLPICARRFRLRRIGRESGLAARSTNLEWMMVLAVLASITSINVTTYSTDDMSGAGTYKATRLPVCNRRRSISNHQQQLLGETE